MEKRKKQESALWCEVIPDIQVLEIGFLHNRNRHPARRSVHYWILVLLEKGQRTLVANDQKIKISAHEFFLIPPGVEQKPLELDEHTACFVHFYAEGKNIPAPKSVNASKLYLPMYGRLPDNTDCFSHLKYLYDHYMSPYADKQFISVHMRALLSDISLHCQKYLFQSVKDLGFLNSCLCFIRENISRTLSCEDYEQKLGLSYHQINQKFKKEFGYTVKQYHHKLRMERAAQLIQSGIVLRQVADECGFEDYYYFIKSFKHEYGVSPSLFRYMQGM